MINRYSLIFIVCTVFFSSCKDKAPEILNFSGFAQGTTYSIVYDNNKGINPEELKVKVEKLLHDFDMSLSLYLDSSVICRLNRNEDVIPDKYFLEVFSKSALVSEMTDGAFDITVAPLVRAWGFGPDAHKNFSESKRDSLLKLVGMDKVSIVNGRLVKTNPAVTLDVNAIAQGYSVDVVCAFFDKAGIKNYLIEIGGEVRGKGTKAGSLWRVGIDKPVDGNMTPGENLQAVIELENKAIATSGNYRKYFVENGIKYSHHINPKTGDISKNTLLSVTVMADECALADGVATGCIVMGKDKAIEFIISHPQFNAYLVYSDTKGNFQTWFSPGLKNLITETGL
jgi:thiamine biosynthesis lipoprotein